MIRSKRYKKLENNLDKTKVYNYDEVFKFLKKLANAKFDESVEVHIRLGIDVSKADQAVRGMVSLPHGTGNVKKIAVFAESTKAEEAKKAGADIIGGDDLIAKIKQTGKIEFDIAVATPDMMKKMAPIAKILGPKGLMPTPKTETVTMDVERVVGELKKGKTEFRSDNSGNVHISIGKISFDSEKLKENFIEFLNTLKNSRPAAVKGEFIKNLSVATTMGPSLRVSFSAKKQ